MAGEADQSPGGIAQEQRIDNALQAATDKHFEDMPPAEIGLDEQVPAKESGTDIQGDEVAKDPAGETDEVPVDNEGDDDVTGDVEGEVEGELEAEADPEGTPAEPEEDPDDLTPRNEDGTFQERFSSVDPNSLPEEVKPIYKSLQADYTRKTQAAAEERRKSQETMAEVAELEERLGSTEGLADFLVEAALADKDAWAKAIETVDRLSHDERERDYYERDHALKRREGERRTETRRQQAADRQAVISSTIVKIQAVETELGIPYDSIEQVVLATITSLQQDGKRVSDADIDRAISAFADPIRKRLGPPKRKAEEAKKYVQKKAAQKKKAAEAASPKSGAPAPPMPRSDDMPVGNFDAVLDRLMEHHGKDM